MGPVIRAATEADNPALAALHSVGFEEHWSAGAMQDLQAMPGAFALIAEEDGAPRGFVLARSVAGEAEILSIGVHPVVRGRGLGRALLTAAAARAASMAATTLFLEVAVDNRPALGLYTALGFQQTGRRKGYYARAGRPAADALILRVDLPLVGSSVGNSSQQG